MSFAMLPTPVKELPIKALNPYKGQWTVKARVTSKSELMNYTNAKGPGKVFSFDIVDSKGDEIHITCFNALVDQFYDDIECDQLYLISNGMIKPASKTFNPLQNEYEIYLDKSSKVERCTEDDNSIPFQQFHFRPISEIKSLPHQSFVDVIGLVTSINPTTPILKKDGSEILKRSLHLKDMSGYNVELTLWGKFCNVEGDRVDEMLTSSSFIIVAVKSCRINDFNGKSLSTLSSSQLLINPDIPAALKIKSWYGSEGYNPTSIPISKNPSTIVQSVRKVISQINDDKLGTSGAADLITVSATISYVKPDLAYTACPLMVGSRQCYNKVTESVEGHWWCGRCDKSVPECEFRYILQLQLQDYTGTTYVTAFQEAGEAIMGVSAKELTLLKESDEEKFSDIMRNVIFKQYTFKLKVKEEVYNGESSVKSIVVKVEPLDFSKESHFLLDSMTNIGG